MGKKNKLLSKSQTLNTAAIDSLVDSLDLFDFLAYTVYR